MKVRCRFCKTTGSSEPLKDGSPGLPKNWKRPEGKLCCPECWKANYAPRALTIPVASILEIDGQPVVDRNAGRKEFEAALAVSWRQATQACNWLLREMALSDNAPLVLTKKKAQNEGKQRSKPKPEKPERKKKSETPPASKINELEQQQQMEWTLPKWEVPEHLQSAGRAQFPILDSQSYYDLYNWVRPMYEKDRYAIRVFNSKRVPQMLYPVPLPIPAKDVTLEGNDEQKLLCVTLRIACHRFKVRLSGNMGKFSRQIAPLLRVAKGELPMGAAKVIEGRDGIKVAITAYIPKQKVEREDKSLFVVAGSTAQRVFTVGVPERPLWFLNEDHVWARIEGHRIRLQRMGEDRKMERRFGDQSRRNDQLQAKRELICKHHNDWLTDYLHKAGSMLVNLAVRQKVARVEWVDLGSQVRIRFPWHRLMEMSKSKLDAVGIELVEIKTAEEQAKLPGWCDPSRESSTDERPDDDAEPLGTR